MSSGQTNLAIGILHELISFVALARGGFRKHVKLKASTAVDAGVDLELFI